MKIGKYIALLCLTFSVLNVYGQNNTAKIKYDDWFRDSTLRVDYLRVGNKKHDTCILQKYSLQNDLWAGSLTQLLDPIDNGQYRLMVVDADTKKPLYSRCYNTLFGEYRETFASNDRDSIASFEEVMLMPMPKKAVEIWLQKRYDNKVFVTSATLRFEPSSFRAGKQIPEKGPVKLLYNGDPHKKIDVVIVAEGYGRKDARKMKNDFKKFTEYLLAEEPFKNRADDFNVWGVGMLMAESGVTDPNADRFVESALNSSYNTFGMDRYLMTTNIFRLHNLLRGVPYDHIIIMANCDTYGGGAIYNYYAFSAVQEMSRMILPHELGHSIGGLADEYVEDDDNYNRRYVGIEPTEPNITTLIEFDKKWKDEFNASTATVTIPTPPAEGLAKRECGPIGVYEGAGYMAKGCYRAYTHCMMRDYGYFCPICNQRLNEVFDLYVK